MGTPATSARRLVPSDAAVTETIGTILLLAVAVVLAGTFVVFLFTVPPPAPDSHAEVATYILPAEPDTVVIEHRGGESIPLQDLQVTLTVGGTTTTASVGERLAAADPAWAVLDADGVAKAATGRFQPGDRVRYTSATVPGAAVEVFLADAAQRSEVLAALAVQATDATAPTFVSAETTSTTTVEVVFSEPLLDVAAADLAVTSPARTIASAELVGNGSRVVVTVTSAWTSDATPQVGTVASPSGTHDLAGNAAAGGASVTAADGTAPSISSVSSGTPTSSAATVTWTTDESANTTVYFGVGPHLGRVATGPSGTSHTASLADLSELTLYWFTVASTDAAGNTATSAGTPFATADDGGGGGGASTVPHYLALTSVPASVASGTTTASDITVTLKNSTSGATVVSSATVTLATNSSRGLFYDSTGTTVVTSVALSGGTAAFEYRDFRTDGGTSVLTASLDGAIAGSGAVLVTAGGTGVQESHLEIASAPATVDSGVVTTSDITVTLKDWTGKTLSRTSTVTLVTNSTDGVFWDSTGASRVTTVALVAGVGTFEYQDFRTDNGTSVVFAHLNGSIPAAAAIKVRTQYGLTAERGDSVSSVKVSLVTTSAFERDNAGATVGMVVANPTGSSVTVDSIAIAVSPTIPAAGGGGPNAEFFRSLSVVTAGSDTGWSGASFSATTANSFTLTPSSTLTVAAYSLTSVTLTYTTQKTTAEDTIEMTGSATVSGTVVSAPSRIVRLDAAGPEIHVTPFDGAARAAWGGPGATRITANAVNTFTLRWNVLSAPSADVFVHRLTLPAGWSSVNVDETDADYSSTNDILVSIRQPTPTQDGWIEFVQSGTPATHDLSFTARTGGSGLYLLDLQERNSVSTSTVLNGLTQIGVRVR